MDAMLFESAVGCHMLAVDGSRIYDLDRETFAEAGTDPSAIRDVLARCSDARSRPYIDDATPALPPLHALSLNVAQTCNLACGYCYADEGRFGGKRRLMDEATARRAVGLLLDEAEPTGSAVLGFMGGEPLQNRSLVQGVTEGAAAEAWWRGIRLGFSITTNATLLTDADAVFLSDHRFTVAVSLDGPPSVNDRQRPDRRGGSSFVRACDGLEKILARSGAHVSIRATVTPRTGPLLPILESLLELGAHEVGFAPVLVSPNPALAFGEENFSALLAHMITCGEAAKKAILERRRFPFSNFETGLHEITRGSHRPYSCSAAAGYGSVSADGGLFACHRSIDDDAFRIGDLISGLDDEARNAFLNDRHVLRQDPCRTCWARFLCGGGCHHEVLARGRPGCDYIRGWLCFLLASYAEISELRPAYFQDPDAYFTRLSEGS
ncbi:MAG: radical SAM protein [Geminicoccaceae bacterium]